VTQTLHGKCLCANVLDVAEPGAGREWLWRAVKSATPQSLHVAERMECVRSRVVVSIGRGCQCLPLKGQRHQGEVVAPFGSQIVPLRVIAIVLEISPSYWHVNV